MTKEIYFDNVLVGWATKASIKDELETEKTPTFSGTLVDGDPNPSVTVSIETLRAGTIQQYINLEKKIKYAKTNPITVQTIITDKGKDGVLTVKEFAYNCMISSDEVEMDPTKRTALKLELVGESRKKIINGTEIK
jgi:hypothetical protein